MLKSIAVLLALVLTSSAWGQDTVPPRTTGDLYVRALAAVVRENNEARARHGDPRGEFSRAFIMQDLRILQSLPPRLDGIEVVYLDDQQLRARYRANRREVPVWELVPMTNEGADIVVALRNYSYSTRGRRGLLAVEGGARVRFRYDCASQDYVIADVEWWGV